MADTARITQNAAELLITQNGTVRITQNAIEIITGVGITCGSPPDGIVGRSYSHILPSGGGTAPLTFTVTAGVLPPGLALNGSTGEVTGIPTTAGLFAFTITVVDSMGTTASVDCSIRILQRFNSVGGGVPVLGCQCCPPPVRTPFKRRKREAEFDAIPCGSQNVQRRGTAQGPATTTPVVICQYQVPTNRRFQLDAVVAIAQTINGWNFGDGNVVFAITINRAGTAFAQGMPFTDYGAVTIPLGSLATPWQIPRTDRIYVESREIVRLTVQTNPVFITPGPDTQFLGLLQGYEWGVE